MKRILIVSLFQLFCQVLFAQKDEQQLDSLGAKKGLWKETWFYENTVVYDCPEPGGYMSGNYVKGKKEGEWVYFYGPSDIREKIIYKNDKPMTCVEYYRNRSKKMDSGTLVDGNGVLKSYDYYGKLIYECTYNNGLKNGEEIIYEYRNKKMTKIYNYTDGVNVSTLKDTLQCNSLDNNGAKTGIWIEPHFEENGFTADWLSYLVGYYRGNYNRGLKNGLWIDYYNNGKVRSKVIYKNDLLWTAIEYRDEKGNTLDPGTLKDGSGVYKIYSYNGKLYDIINYSNGQLYGKEFFYYDNGKIANEYDYSSPQSYKEIDYNKDGTLREKSEYKNYRPYGVDSIYNKHGILTTYTVYTTTGNKTFDSKGNKMEEIIWNKNGTSTLIKY